jgi:hypothetical protein
MLTANSLPPQQQMVLLQDAVWVALQAAYVARQMTYAMPYDAVTADKVRTAHALLSEAWGELRLAREQDIEQRRLSACKEPPLE